MWHEKVSRRRVSALTNIQDEDPYILHIKLAIAVVNVIAVGFYIPTPHNMSSCGDKFRVSFNAVIVDSILDTKDNMKIMEVYRDFRFMKF